MKTTATAKRLYKVMANGLETRAYHYGRAKRIWKDLREGRCGNATGGQPIMGSLVEVMP